MLYKICHITSVHSHNDTRIFIKECCTLASAGYSTHLIAPDAPDTIKNSVYLHGVKKTNRGRFSRMTKTVWEAYKKAISIDADIYHFHDPELFFVVFLLKLKGKRVIYDMHEDVPNDIMDKEWIPILIRKPISFIFNIFQNLLLRFFDITIVAEKSYLKNLAKSGNYCVIRNYTILNELRLNNIEWNEKNRAVCYVGTIAKSRGIFEIIKAIDQTDAKLLLAGQFSSSNQMDEAKALPGWANVEYLGQLNRKEVARVLHRSMAGLVILHPRDNFINSEATKMFEYMSAGIPVIASNFPLWKEIVEKNHCGICIDPLKPEEIAKAVQWILSHPEESKRMGANGRKSVEEKYNWEDESKKLLKLYRELLR